MKKVNKKPKIKELMKHWNNQAWVTVKVDGQRFLIPSGLNSPHSYYALDREYQSELEYYILRPLIPGIAY